MLAWWYVLSSLGVIRMALTIGVMLLAPVVMQAAMRNPSLWIGLVFSARARQARTLVFMALRLVRFASLAFVVRRVAHYLIGLLVLPGTWLLGDARRTDSTWMAAIGNSSMKRLRGNIYKVPLLVFLPRHPHPRPPTHPHPHIQARTTPWHHTTLQRAEQGRRRLEDEFGGQALLLTTADGEELSCLLLRPLLPAPTNATSSHPTNQSSPTALCSPPSDAPVPSSSTSASISASRASSTQPKASLCTRKPSSVPTIIRFNGNAEAWEMSDPRLVKAYLDNGFQVLVQCRGSLTNTSGV